MPTHDMRNEMQATVRKGSADETEALARVLARAFEDDPVSAFILPDQSRRLRGLEEMYRWLFVPDSVGDDECYTTSDHACVALWAPAGKPKPGTEPDRQGQGFGSLLLRHALTRLDAEGTPAYLEASTPRNRALYLRHGFVVLSEIRLPGGGPPLWRMWRDPAQPDPAQPGAPT